MVIELGLPVSECSTRISKFCAPTNSEHKFNKTKIGNWLIMGFNLGPSWLGTHSHNHYTMFNHQWGESKGFIYLGVKISVWLQWKPAKFTVYLAKINLKSILLAGYSWLCQKAVFNKLANVVFLFLLNKNFRLEFVQSFHINLSAC